MTSSLKIEFISNVSLLSYIILEMIFLLCRAVGWKLLNVMRRTDEGRLVRRLGNLGVIFVGSQL